MAGDAQPTVREAAEAIARESGKDLLAALILDVLEEGVTVWSDGHGGAVARIRLEEGAVVVNLLERPGRLLNRVGDSMERLDAPGTPFGAWRWVVEYNGHPVGEWGRGAEGGGVDARRVARALIRSMVVTPRE